MLTAILMTLAAFASAIDCYAGAPQSPGAAAPGSQLSYDAVDPKDRRKSPPVRVVSEDHILDHARRQKGTANSRDIARNFAIAAWMVRKHLDYVSQFDFHCRSGNDSFDEAVESFVRRWSLRSNFDVAGRHRRSRFLRIAEARRVVDGDVLLVKLASGHVQAIEGDRVRNRSASTAEVGRNAQNAWIHGVECDPSGRALRYCVHRRTQQGGLEWERDVPAEHAYLHGYHERFDQVRGISPLMSGLNSLRDVYENFDYALAKAKVSQLFALAIYSQFESGVGNHEIEEPVDGEEADDDAAPRYNVDLGRGPVKLELQNGDRAEFLESRTPSSEFQTFTQAIIMVALKSLDMPYSFYDESFTNFFGSRAAWMHYERSAREKREDNRELLTELTRWRLRLAVLDGQISLPKSVVSLDDVPLDWVATGMPWWDPAKEIRGDVMAIGAGLDNPQRICKERGRGDFYDNLREIAKAKAYAKELGLDLSFDPGVGPRQQRKEAAKNA